MDVTETFRFEWFGDIHGPKPYKFTGSRTKIVSHTPLWHLEPSCCRAEAVNYDGVATAKPSESIMQELGA